MSAQCIFLPTSEGMNEGRVRVMHSQCDEGHPDFTITDFESGKVLA